MKFYIIGDREMVLAFKLTGIDGTVAETRQEVLDAFNRMTGKGGAVSAPVEEVPHILILTEGAASTIEEEEIESGLFPAHSMSKWRALPHDKQSAFFLFHP